MGSDRWRERVDHALGAAFGDVCNFRAGNAHKVERQCHRFAVEVAAGDNRFIVREEQRIVGDCVKLDFDFIFDIVQCIADGAVYLRDAAQRVSVLYAVVLAVGKDFGAFGEQGRSF